MDLGQVILGFIIAATGVLVAVTNWLNQRTAAQKLANDMAESNLKRETEAKQMTAAARASAQASAKAVQGVEDVKQTVEDVRAVQDATHVLVKQVAADSVATNPNKG